MQPLLKAHSASASDGHIGKEPATGFVHDKVFTVYTPTNYSTDPADHRRTWPLKSPARDCLPVLEEAQMAVSQVEEPTWSCRQSLLDLAHIILLLPCD